MEDCHLKVSVDANVVQIVRHSRRAGAGDLRCSGEIRDFISSAPLTGIADTHPFTKVDDSNQWHKEDRFAEGLTGEAHFEVDEKDELDQEEESEGEHNDGDWTHGEDHHPCGDEKSNQRHKEDRFAEGLTGQAHFEVDEEDEIDQEEETDGVGGGRDSVPSWRPLAR
jgi:hypothetical protein